MISKNSCKYSSKYSCKFERKTPCNRQKVGSYIFYKQHNKIRGILAVATSLCISWLGVFAPCHYFRPAPIAVVIKIAADVVKFCTFFGTRYSWKLPLQFNRFDCLLFVIYLLPKIVPSTLDLPLLPLVVFFNWLETRVLFSFFAFNWHRARKFSASLNFFRFFFHSPSWLSFSTRQF